GRASVSAARAPVHRNGRPIGGDRVARLDQLGRRIGQQITQLTVTTAQQHAGQLDAEFVIPEPDRHTRMEDRAYLAVLAVLTSLLIVLVTGVGQAASRQDHVTGRAGYDRVADAARTARKDAGFTRRRQAPQRTLVVLAPLAGGVRP